MTAAKKFVTSKTVTSVFCFLDYCIPDGEGDCRAFTLCFSSPTGGRPETLCNYIEEIKPGNETMMIL